MGYRLLASAALCGLMIQGAAFAQSSSMGTQNSTSPSAAESSNSSAAQTAQSLPQEIRQKLQNQGFSDVKVVPGSFIVSAKDKDGDPTLMMIGPHSMTVMMGVSSNQNSTTGSANQQENQSQGLNGSESGSQGTEK